MPVAHLSPWRQMYNVVELLSDVLRDDRLHTGLGVAMGEHGILTYKTPHVEVARKRVVEMPEGNGSEFVGARSQYFCFAFS